MPLASEWTSVARSVRSGLPHLPASLRVDTLVELCRILDEDVAAVLLARAADARIAGYLEAVAQTGRATGGRWLLDGPDPAPLSEVLVPFAGAEALLEDVRHLVEVLLTLTGAPRAGVRLEVLDRAMCPRWHVDRTGLRLLCTYRGPGTEWLREDGSERTWLGTPAADPDAGVRGPAPEAARVCRAAPFDVLILKGDAWPEWQGRGVIHRSPAVLRGSGPRFVLTVDAVWD